MQVVDWLALGILILTALIGILLGFGKLLKLFTGGIFGIIICIILTYFLLGVVSSWGFVQDITSGFRESAEAKGGFVNFLYTIAIEKIALAIVLFVALLILRFIAVRIIKGIVEIDRPLIRAINKIVGMLFSLALLVVFTLIVFQIVYWIGGDTADSFREYLDGSKLRLNDLFENNPLKYVYQR